MPNRDHEVKNVKKTPQKGSADDVREAALKLLHRLFQDPEEGTPLAVMLARSVQTSGLSERDAALLSELVFGVLRRSALLDALLSGFLKKPAALSSQVRTILRIGALELLFMDGIPPRATVHELAGLARRRFGQGMGGLVNAVLRSVDRERDRLMERVSKAEPFELASIPAWLSTMWTAQFGPEAAGFSLNTLAHAAPCWRVNRAKEGADALRNEWLERGYAPVGNDGFTSFGLDRSRPGAKDEQDELRQLEEQGALTRQGTSSQLVAEFIAGWLARDQRLSGGELWDACCGRGGKSTALLEKGVNVALSSDPAPFRVEELKKAVQRLGLKEPRIVCAPEQEVEASFPLILLDVPCTGTGTLGRVPELRLRLSPEKLREAEKLQRAILENAWTKLQPGGVLFYVTCALNKRENEEQIASFLASRSDNAASDATLVEQRLFLPELPGHDALFLTILKKVS